MEFNQEVKLATDPIYKKSIQRWKNYEKNFAEIDVDLNFWKNELKY